MNEQDNKKSGDTDTVDLKADAAELAKLGLDGACHALAKLPILGAALWPCPRDPIRTKPANSLYASGWRLPPQTTRNTDPSMPTERSP